MKSQLKDEGSLQSVEVEDSRAQAKIRDDLDLCICKIDSIIDSFPVEAFSSVEDVRLNIGKVTDHLATYNYLIPRFVQMDTSDEEYPLVLARAVDYVKEGRSKIDHLSNKDVVHANASTSSSGSSDKDLQLLNRLIDEVSYIENSLTKLSKVDFADCRDEELLDSQKELKDKYHKCDMLSEKITLLYSQMPVEHVDREAILAQHAKDEKTIRGIIDAYRDRLKNEIARRNVSRERLSSSKNSCVTLKKFGGFDSEVDIYSFQTDFEKLVTPYVQSKLLPYILN